MRPTLLYSIRGYVLSLSLCMQPTPPKKFMFFMVVGRYSVTGVAALSRPANAGAVFAARGELRRKLLLPSHVPSAVWDARIPSLLMSPSSTRNLQKSMTIQLRQRHICVPRFTRLDPRLPTTLA